MEKGYKIVEKSVEEFGVVKLLEVYGSRVALGYPKTAQILALQANIEDDPKLQKTIVDLFREECPEIKWTFTPKKK